MLMIGKEVKYIYINVLNYFLLGCVYSLIIKLTNLLLLIFFNNFILYKIMSGIDRYTVLTVNELFDRLPGGIKGNNQKPLIGVI